MAGTMNEPGFVVRVCIPDLDQVHALTSPDRPRDRLIAELGVSA
jgi:hypothetical protein